MSEFHAFMDELDRLKDEYNAEARSALGDDMMRYGEMVGKREALAEVRDLAREHLAPEADV